MPAAVYLGDGDMAVREVPVPVPGPGEALVEVSHCGTKFTLLGRDEGKGRDKGVRHRSRLPIHMPSCFLGLLKAT